MALTGSGTIGGSEAMQAQRERYWEEATDADKIERLRDEVARLCKIVGELSSVVVKLGSHGHGADGRMMVALETDIHGNRALGLFAHDNGIPHRIRREYERR